MIAYLGMLLFFRFLGVYYLKTVAPLYKYFIELIKPTYQIVAYNIVELKGILYLKYTAVVQGVARLADGTPYQERPVIECGVLSSTLYIQPIITFFVLLIIPGLSMRSKLKAGVLSMVLLVVAGLMDTPFVVIGGITNQLQLPVSLFGQMVSFWNIFLYRGGRNLIAVLVAVIAVIPFYLRKRV
ncbi:MAG: hypothetical protein CSYNP_03346 [Syntrophus sp. SKADARSKE-3]|nr:hypothetical protein [Syntrophus sp. SKADARSKE-3]